MFERAPKPASKSLPAQRVSDRPKPAPAAAARSLGPSALPRYGFASLAVHPPIVQLNGKGSKNQAKKAKKASGKVMAASAATGALNVAAFGANWEKRDWREHTKALDLHNFTPKAHTDTNKTIMSNPNGHQIVIDNQSNYWRHLDEKEKYVDSTGTPNTNPAMTHFHHK